MSTMKSMLIEVQALYDAIFLDLIALHPSISAEIERDRSRLQKAALSKGLSLYTIVLPTACKWFDKSLSVGRLVEPRPAHFGVKGKEDKRPAFLFGFFSQIFKPDGTLGPDVDIPSIASVRTILRCVKKLEIECEERYTNESVQSFRDIEESLPRPWTETWDCDNPRWSDLDGHPIWGNPLEFDRQTSLFDSANPLLQLDFEPHWERFRRFSARILHQFGQFHPYKVRPKHGPGAVADKLESYVKYDFKHWTHKLESVFPYDWHASTDLSVPDYVVYREFASKMCAVPKEASGPRLIAAEPIAHQWIQQGILDWLLSSIKTSSLSWCLNIRDQEPSRDLALEASREGRYATVDLSSASDRLTCRLVQYVFQSRIDLLDAFHACRTRACVDLDGNLILLKKFSTQGSALTFPIQSIVYSLLAIWSVMITRGWTDDVSRIKAAAKEVRVYGDDIIVPVDAYPVLAGLLKTCLLKVNESKTHDTGYFRESCGMDAYGGVDVTPPYLRHLYSASPEHLSSIVQVSNNFFKKGLWNSAEHLLKTVPYPERKLIAVGEGLGSVNLFSFCGASTAHLSKRWNRDLHKWEARAIVTTSRVTYKHGDGNGPLVQFFFQEPDPSLKYQSGQSGRPTLRKKVGWVDSQE